MKRLVLILGPTVALIALLRWCEQRMGPHRFDRLLALRGSGRHIWADEHADQFVQNLRAGWE